MKHIGGGRGTTAPPPAVLEAQRVRIRAALGTRRKAKRMTDIDWRDIAVRVARANGAFYQLTTPQRDALELAIADAPPYDPAEMAADVPASLAPPHQPVGGPLDTSAEALAARGEHG